MMTADGNPSDLGPGGKKAPDQPDSSEAMFARMTPGVADPWRVLADQLALEGDFAAADQAYLKHVEAAQKNPILMQAGIALVRDQVSAAERILKPFLQQNPTDVAAIRMLAEVAGRIGRYEDAENLLRRAWSFPRALPPRASIWRSCCTGSIVRPRRRRR